MAVEDFAIQLLGFMYATMRVRENLEKLSGDGFPQWPDAEKKRKLSDVCRDDRSSATSERARNWTDSEMNDRRGGPTKPVRLLPGRDSHERAERQTRTENVPRRRVLFGSREA